MIGMDRSEIYIFDNEEKKLNKMLNNDMKVAFLRKKSLISL